MSDDYRIMFLNDKSPDGSLRQEIYKWKNNSVNAERIDVHNAFL